MALSDLNLFTAVDSNVKAYWNLQEANATDTWDNGEGTSAWDLVPNSGNEPQVSTSVVNGDFARSRIGDNNDYASMSDPGFPTGAFTIEMIVYGDDDTADTEGIFAQYNTTTGATNRSFYVQRGGGTLGTNRIFQFGVSGDGTTFQTVSTAQLNNAQWYYLAFVYEPSTALRIYVDGVQVAFNITSIPAALTNATTIIAAMRYNATWGAANAFDGLLQAMRVSDVARPNTFIASQWDTLKRAVATVSNDTWISANATTTNYNSDGRLVVGDVGGSDRGRALLRFTLPSDPNGSGSTITKVELQMYYYDSNGSSAIDINVYEDNGGDDSAGWLDSQATWIHSESGIGNTWTVAGAASDFSSTIIDTNALGATSTKAFESWVLVGTGATNPITVTWGETINLLVRAPSSASENRYFEDSAATSAQQPKIVVTYTDPAGASVNANFFAFM